MCGGGHTHNHGPSSDVQAQPVDTIEVLITRAGIIRIVTGQMQTAHSTIQDAIEAFARMANVSIESAEPVLRALVEEHEHARERIPSR